MMLLFLNLSTEFIHKFLKFGMVGFSGFIIDFGITYLCKEIIRIPKYVSNGIGFLIAATSNYFLNRIWTFQSDNPNVAGEYIEFIFVSIIGLILNTLIVYLLSEKLKWNFYFSKVCAIAIVTFWNFFANLYITFKT
jgi:putative flippase GtrA